MQLKEFGLISAAIEASEVFRAIETAIPVELIDATIGHTAAIEERKRKLPSSLVVCLVIAMSLWSSDSMGTVLKNLVNGLSRQWTKLGQYWQVPNSASITAARSASRVSGNESVISTSGAAISHTTNTRSIFGGTTGDGSGWMCVRCSR